MSVFLIFWGIGAAAAVVYLLIKYVLPLILFILYTIYEILKSWSAAFAEGWRKARDGNK